MGLTTTQQMADRVAALMEDRLKVRGKGLDAKLRNGGRRLPRKIRKEAEYLSAMAQLAHHPKVQMMMDEGRVAHAYDACVRHLGQIGARDRLVGRVLGVTGSVAFALLVIGGGFIAFLVWRGYL